MVPDTEIEDLEAHRAQAAARGFTVVHDADKAKWILTCPQGNYRGSQDTEELAWRCAPRDRRLVTRADDAACQ